MKKLSFALACIIGLMFFASCKKDSKLTITPIKTQGYVTDGAEVNIGETIKFGFDATGTDLDVFSYLITAGDSSVGEEIFLEKQTSYSFTGSYTAENAGTVTIVGTIKNVKGETVTSTMTINVKNSGLTITPNKEDGYITDGAEVPVFHTFKYGFDAYGTDLIHFSCTIEAGGETTTEETDLNNANNHTHIETHLPLVPGEVKITATVKNAQGETASATITVNVVETENYKFVGNYAGSLEGEVSIEIMGQTQVNNIEYDAQLELLAGENDDEVMANYIQDGTEYNVKGTCNGNTVTFEPITVTYSETGSDMEIEINLKGTINGNSLFIEGTAETQGEIQIPMPVPFVMHININGTLDKQ